MLKYFVTVVTVGNTGQLRVHHFERNEDTIEELVKKELGGWATHTACTSGPKERHKKEFFQAGVTKNGFPFSILAVWEERFYDQPC